MKKTQPVPFEDLFSIPLKNGLTRPKAIRGSGTKMINMGELFAHSRIKNVDADRVPFSENEESYLLEDGDLLFARQSLVLAGAGKCSIFMDDNEPVTYEGHIIRARLNKEIVDPFFYYYFFNSPVGRSAIESIVEQVAAAGVRGSDLAKLKVPRFPLPEQHAIAGILGALDDKIELNRRMNRTLESMARAVFRQWFVENEDVEGWKVGKLGDLCESTIGGDWGEEQEFEDSVPVICLRGVDLDSLRKDGYSEDAPIRWIKKSSLEKRQLSDCDILIAGSGIGPVGKPLWVSPDMLKAYSYPVIYSNFVKRFRAKSPEYAMYVDRILFNMRESNEIWDYVNGTSIPNLDDKGLLDYSQTPIPPEDKVKAFHEYAIPIYAKLYKKESRTLASLRDGLLPKLMRGEVRVRVKV